MFTCTITVVFVDPFFIFFCIFFNKNLTYERQTTVLRKVVFWLTEVEFIGNLNVLWHFTSDEENRQYDTKERLLSFTLIKTSVNVGVITYCMTMYVSLFVSKIHYVSTIEFVQKSRCYYRFHVFLSMYMTLLFFLTS